MRSVQGLRTLGLLGTDGFRTLLELGPYGTDALGRCTFFWGTPCQGRSLCSGGLSGSVLHLEWGLRCTARSAIQDTAAISALPFKGVSGCGPSLKPACPSAICCSRNALGS